MALSPKQITRALDRVLHKVEQPARYTGGELNSIAKDWTDPSIRTKVALAFPDIYVNCSNIVIVNGISGVGCCACFYRLYGWCYRNVTGFTRIIFCNIILCCCYRC